MVRVKSKDNEESIQRWLDKEVKDGENTILVYPNIQTFRQIYSKYVKDKLAAAREQEVEQNNNNNNSSRETSRLSKSRIILIAPFYETVDSVKHHLTTFGVENVQGLIDSGSLVIAAHFAPSFQIPMA